MGETESLNYPTTPGAYDESYNVGLYGDAFVSKLDSSLSTLLASTFIGGGDGGEWCKSIALDDGGNVYITGRTWSFDYPTTPGAYDESYNGNDSYVSKLNSTLSTLLASTFIGGGDRDESISITLDDGGNVYVSGFSWSSDYPTTPGAYDESFNGGDDAFVSKLDSSLSLLLASTFLGGYLDDLIKFTTFDGSGNIYVIGHTDSSDFPITPGSYDESFNSTHPAYSDVYVSKINSSLSTLLASTFIGGVHNDSGNSIILDGIGNVYITGCTDSSDFPTTPGAYDESFNSRNVFISKLDSNLSGDPDSDGIFGEDDNCIYKPNGPDLGTCVQITGSIVKVTGVTCASDEDCNTDNDEFCEMEQLDSDGNGIGDACECEGDFDCDGDVDASDVINFLTDFGRGEHNSPCTNEEPCNGDFNCDSNVDAADVTKFLEDFGRSEFFNPCPACEVGVWCVY